MKLTHPLCVLMILIPCVSLCAESAIKNLASELPRQVGRRLVSDEVRLQANQLPTSELRINYLSSVIVSTNRANSDVDNCDKGSAIRLLGVIAHTNSISILLSNLTFIDRCYQDRPAIAALASVGEAATPNLLAVLKDESASDDQVYSAVEVLKLIKKATPNFREWYEFINDQKKHLPSVAWERLDRYGSVVD